MGRIQFLAPVTGLLLLLLLPLLALAGEGNGTDLNDAYYFPTINCPVHPRALCDFYFDGFKNLVPTFYLDDQTPGDHVVVPIRRSTLNWMGSMDHFAPGVKEYQTGRFVLANTRNATFLKYPDGTYDEDWAKKTFDQFYLNAKTDAVSHLSVRAWKGEHGMAFYSGKCVFLPFSGAWIRDTSINLNQRDNNEDYPVQRRCVVFKTEQ